MLRIENLVFDAWGRRFFDSASVAIPTGTKVGLVGRNGVGKSTLFKIIIGDLVPLSGEILLPKSAQIGSVDQEHPATPVTLIDTILAAVTDSELGSASGVLTAIQQLGAALGVAALGTLFFSTLTHDGFVTAITHSLVAELATMPVLFVLISLLPRHPVDEAELLTAAPESDDAALALAA